MSDVAFVGRRAGQCGPVGQKRRRLLVVNDSSHQRQWYIYSVVSHALVLAHWLLHSTCSYTLCHNPELVRAQRTRRLCHVESYKSTGESIESLRPSWQHPDLFSSLTTLSTIVDVVTGSGPAIRAAMHKPRQGSWWHEHSVSQCGSMA